MMYYRTLTDFFEARRQQGQPLALATVYDTRGSTYSKPGARMLIDANGIFQGMLSGGCLEGDLAIRAQQVIASNLSQTASYDLASDDDELWGLGVGCDGLIRVFLQPLTDQQGYEPFASICQLCSGASVSMAATVIASTSNSIVPGTTVLPEADTQYNPGVGAKIQVILETRCQELLTLGQSAFERLSVAGHDLEVLYSPIEPAPRLLVLGAGLDAEPVVRFAVELGWRCTVVDHRPAYIETNRFDNAKRLVCCAADDVHEHVDLDSFDMAVVMSHHLSSDRAYLGQLAASAVGYIGLLGPRARKERLLSELDESAGLLQGRLHGPAGLDIGGRGPAAIALAIVAEMQQECAAATFSASLCPAESSE